jgi:hypothetical protein
MPRNGGQQILGQGRVKGRQRRGAVAGELGGVLSLLYQVGEDLRG